MAPPPELITEPVTEQLIKEVQFNVTIPPLMARFAQLVKVTCCRLIDLEPS